MVNPPIIFTILVDIPELLLVESLAGKSPELKKIRKLMAGKIIELNVNGLV
jgi:hypothetical protein